MNEGELHHFLQTPSVFPEGVTLRQSWVICTEKKKNLIVYELAVPAEGITVRILTSDSSCTVTIPQAINHLFRLKIYLVASPINDKDTRWRKMFCCIFIAKVVIGFYYFLFKCFNIL